MTNLQEFIQSIAFDSERFLPVNDFEGRFWISDFGRVISKKHDNFYLLSNGLDAAGYKGTRMRNRTYRRDCRIHQLVGEHFCEMVDLGVRMTWNHIYGNKLNKHYTNLEYVTAKENCLHAQRTGLCDIKGEKHGMSKMKNEDVIAIYNMRNSGLTASEVSLSLRFMIY